MEINHELLEKVLKQAIEKDSIVLEKNELKYTVDFQGRFYINIHELANKYKEWASSITHENTNLILYNLTSGFESYWCNELKKGYKTREYVKLVFGDFGCVYNFYNTEPKAIIEACEFIYNHYRSIKK